MTHHTHGKWKNTAFVDKEKPGVIRFSDGDEFSGALVGCRANEIVSRYNAAPKLLEALEEIVKCEIRRRDDLATISKKPKSLYEFSEIRIQKALSAIAAATVKS